jgi:geranylgeranyl diphosphate synthase type I
MSPSASSSASRALVQAVRQRVDARLAVHLDAAEARASEAGGAPREIMRVVSALVRRGGKRLRPALVAAGFLATAAETMGDELPSSVVDAGCALELLQAYFLIHDDWMDGDDTRRGGPTAHVQLAAHFGDAQLGAATAVLAGDLASALAHRVLIAIDAAPDVVREATDAFARVHEEVVLGQALDLGLASEDAAAVERMHALKTGSYTVRGPLEIGAILARASSPARRALASFAAPIGVAFQLQDDLLGTFGDERVTGKPVGSDLRSRKRNALVVDAIARAGGADRARLEALLRARGESMEETDVRWAMSLVEACGARAAIEARLAALLERGRAAAGDPSIREEGRALLVGLAELLCSRSA